LPDAPFSVPLSFPERLTFSAILAWSAPLRTRSSQHYTTSSGVNNSIFILDFVPLVAVLSQLLIFEDADDSLQVNFIIETIVFNQATLGQQLDII